MTEVISGQIESLLLATVANNALAHLPAITGGSLVKAARVTMGEWGIRVTATDGYTAGSDWAPWWDYYTGGEWTFEITRETLQGWDSAGRKDKATDPSTGKRTSAIGWLEYRPEDGTVFRPNSEEVPPEAHLLGVSELPEEAWSALLDSLGDVEDEDIKTAFQPGLLQRFAKVKADKGDRVADLAISDPERPVLVKIGPTFRGLIMPVKRERHAAHVGDREGMW